MTAPSCRLLWQDCGKVETPGCHRGPLGCSTLVMAMGGWFMTAHKDGALERIDPPQYVAFRKSDGGSTLTVEVTPNGHFRDVPVDADRYAIDESVATDLIHLIRNGQSLPRRLVRLLPEIIK